MRLGTTALQAVRTPALLLLLWAMHWPLEPLEWNLRRLNVSDARLPWAYVCVISLAFVVVMLAGRHRMHPWAVLAVEGGVAGLVAFVPPWRWLWWESSLGQPWTRAMSGRFAQPLAVAWFGVVLVLALRQYRRARVAAAATESDGLTISDQAGTDIVEQ